MTSLELYKADILDRSSDTYKIIIYLVRHGESEQNITLGTDPIHNVNENCSNGLTTLGKMQATQLGEHLRAVKFHKAYASDFLRAVETAKIILGENQANKISSPVEIKVNKEFREIYFGELSLASYSDKAAYYVSCNKPLDEVSFPGGESFVEVGSRMVQHFENLCSYLFEEMETAKTENQMVNILVTCHSLAILAFLHFLSHAEKNGHSHVMQNWNLETDLKMLNNCCYFKLEICKLTGKAEKDYEKIGLKICVLEKYASAKKITDGTGNVNCGEENKDNAGISENELRSRRVLMSSKKGREILHCCQQ